MHFDARDYDPVVPHWLSPDPARQHWSGYLGMGNNPVMKVDPDGRQDWFTNLQGSSWNSREVSPPFKAFGFYSEQEYSLGNRMKVTETQRVYGSNEHNLFIHSSTSFEGSPFKIKNLKIPSYSKDQKAGITVGIFATNKQLHFQQAGEISGGFQLGLTGKAFGISTSFNIDTKGQYEFKLGYNFDPKSFEFSVDPVKAKATLTKANYNVIK